MTKHEKGSKHEHGKEPKGYKPNANHSEMHAAESQAAEDSLKEHAPDGQAEFMHGGAHKNTHPKEHPRTSDPSNLSEKGHIEAPPKGDVDEEAGESGDTGEHGEEEAQVKGHTRH